VLSLSKGRERVNRSSYRVINRVTVNPAVSTLLLIKKKYYNHYNTFISLFNHA
jgi:hypothetical protein